MTTEDAMRPPAAGTARPGAPVWTAEEIRRVGHRVVDIMASYLTELPEGPVFRPVPPTVAAALTGAPMPAQGATADAILDDFARSVAPYPFGNGHPRFYGWVNSPPTVMSIFADALAAMMNPSVAGGNHGAVYIEHQVVDWFKAILGFPSESAGLLVSGGSAAALTALAVARHVACRTHGWDVRAHGMQQAGATDRRLVVYKGAEGHGCHQKAVELLGLGSTNLRIVPSDGALRMIPEALEAQLREDRAAGSIPMAVIATAGTVNTGAIDPLDAVADVCARHGVWLHVDGAYGAPAILTPAYEARLAAIARADSVAVDPHKWLYVPVEAGLVLVKDAAAMRDTFSLVPAYLRTDGDVHGVQGPPWFSEFGVQQTRGFRALKVWMAMRYHGVEGYRQLIAHDLALAAYLAQRVRETNDLELHEPPGLSIVCFRCVPPGRVASDPAAVDALNRVVLEELQLGGGAFVSSTVLDGRFWLRACIVNPLASEADIETLLALVREGAARAMTERARMERSADSTS
jgi:glutamate/tyrosine decarboxylase-like PLP-dependent enzyme